jgi:dTDP-4-amino-4,6-dideoxygalactose transaminase
VALGEAEEEAAADAARAVIAGKRLFRYYGASGSPFERSRVKRFEREFARETGTAHSLALNSGTSALVTGLVAMGVGPGDEVIVPGYTWFSSAGAVIAAGAVPVICEVDDSLTIDVDDAAERITQHTHAIMPVHMRGAPAPMDGVMALAREHELLVLEDVAQAAGARFHGRPLGGIGHAGAFSFQMSKAMTAGEGGMLTTGDGALRARASMYHDSAAVPNTGAPPGDWLPGLNLRMSELHAAVLLVQLGRLAGLVADMRERKGRIKRAVADAVGSRGGSFRALHDPDGDSGLSLVFFLPEADAAARVVAALAGDNVPATRLYNDGKLLPNDYVDLHAYEAWIPLHEKRAWSERGGPWRGHPREVEYPPDGCPRTMDLLRRAVHIDVSPQLTETQAEEVGEATARTIERLA